MLERTGFLQRMREITEAIYDALSPLYWSEFGLYENTAHIEHLSRFLDSLERGGTILSAACGAGRYDGILLEAGFDVVGIDQSHGMLERARERLPQVSYIKMGLSELDFNEKFDGAICIDAMEHLFPEDWPVVLAGFKRALKPRGRLYFTVEIANPEELGLSYEHAQRFGLPVVFGEVADRVEYSYEKVISQKADISRASLTELQVYHFCPPLSKVRMWLEQAGLLLEEEGEGSGYYHIVASS